jgi:hypothetical protein
VTLTRKAIRRYCKDLLLGETIAEDKVVTNRSDPIWATQVPSIVIFNRREEIDLFSDNRKLEREARIGIAAFVETDDNSGLPIDDQIDDIAQQIEDRINPNMGLPGLKHLPITLNLKKSHLESVLMEDSPDGVKVVGNVMLTYLWVYYTQPSEEDGKESTPFLEAGLDWDFAPPDAELEARDEIPLTPV